MCWSTSSGRASCKQMEARCDDHRRFQTRAFLLGSRRRRRSHPPDAARAQEPADLRSHMQNCATRSATSPTPTTSRRSCSPPAAATSAPAATCTRSSSPLLDRDMKGLLAFTRMTGDLVKAMRACPQPIIAAIDGICVGAGAMIALASDMRLGTPEAKTAFLFTRVGLAGCDMGACAMLPRIIGQGRASELLFTGRTMTRRRRRPLGLLQSPAARRRPRSRSAEARARRWRAARPSPTA